MDSYGMYAEDAKSKAGVAAKPVQSRTINMMDGERDC
jgi:hypothetical protein